MYVKYVSTGLDGRGVDSNVDESIAKLTDRRKHPTESEPNSALGCTG